MSLRPNLVGASIFGGLGNQMFQYAAGLAVAERLGAKLVCDIRHYQLRDRGDRRLGLAEFGIELSLTRIPRYNRWQRPAVALWLLPDPLRGAIRIDNYEGYDPRAREAEGPVALFGHFQSWRYFEGHETSVRRAFDTRKLTTPRTADIAAEIATARNPVAVHVRRGDYTATPEALALYETLRADYYFAAKAELETRIDAPTYFLFSDDPEIAQAELVGWEGLRPVTGFSAYEDMHLISSCKHFITANSTFSWWAAWLGAAPDKQVVGPKRWFGPAYPKPVDPDDRLPPGWIRV